MKSTGLLLVALIFSFHFMYGQPLKTKKEFANLQGTFYGIVTSGESGPPIANVTVKTIGLIQKTTLTDLSGSYEILIDIGNYDVEFSIIGYDTVIVLDTAVIVSVMTEINISMPEIPYSVTDVVATPNSATATCLINWQLPTGPYEIIYDDGEADDYAIWAMSGGAVAARFTPVGYPGLVLGGRIYVGDGSFPSGGNFLGSNMEISIMDDDGTNGLPGTIIDNAIISVNNYGWVDFYGSFNIEFQEGDFYITMKQLGSASNSAPIGIDTDMPTVYKSYAKLPDSDIWSISPYQDFMIRAYVNGPNQRMVSNNCGNIVNLPTVEDGPYIVTGKPFSGNGVVKNGIIKPVIENENLRSPTGYNVARVSNFIPCLGPENGILTVIGNPDFTQFNDIDFPMISPGYYAYAVQTNYINDSSVWVYSNVISAHLEKEVSFIISLCEGEELENTNIEMAGLFCISNNYQSFTDTNGVAVMDSVIEGYYALKIKKVGFETFAIDSLGIFVDTTIVVELLPAMYPPRNMFVDTITNIATWDEPLITALPKEDFEESVFPPVGWQTTTVSDHSWWRTDHFSDPEWTGWIVPPGDGFYAIANTDLASAGYHPLDYLITPQVDLRADSVFHLIFDQYFDGSHNHDGYVEYSYDDGITWDTIMQATPLYQHWVNVDVDLSDLSGPESEPLWFAFHSSDNNQWGSGWAVDNVRITGNTADFQGYYVFLNSDTIAQLSENEHSYYFNDLSYGENYLACVAAIYTCGLSEPDCFQWESGFLFPPRNFHDTYLYNNYNVPLWWNVPLVDETDSIPKGLVSFNLYQDDTLISSIPYQGQDTGFLFSYIIDSVIPGTYVFSLKSVYDLTLYGYQDDTAESRHPITDTIKLHWGNSLPFFEDWDSEVFYTNHWIVNDTNENWQINKSEGNPYPCLEFTGQPQILEPYESSVTSTYFLADSLNEGAIFVDFDIMYISQVSTGNERLNIEVFDGDDWQLMKYFHNVGNLDYFSCHIDISELVKEKLFQVRFTAIGENSSDIVGWFIDNISIYRTCDAPYELSGAVDWHSFESPANKICWTDPGVPPPANSWLYWDNRNNYSGIGLSEDGSFSAAARWTPDQLEQYEGASVTKIEYFVREGFTSLKLKIWRGYPPSVVRIKDVTLTTIPNEWNICELPYPFPIDVSLSLWVGYTVEAPGDTFPAGIDNGPGVKGSGDMINTGTNYWYSVSNNGYNNNWNIAVYLDENGKSNNNPPAVSEIELPRSNSRIVMDPNTSLNINNRGSVNARALNRFNIYRQDASTGSDYILYDVLPYDSIQEQYCYFDTVPNVIFQNAYCYKVTAVWESQIDFCESEPAKTLDIPTDDYVCIFLEDINDIVNSTLIKVFPNPVNDNLNITSITPIENITISNYIGQIVYSKEIENSKNVVLNIDFLNSGVYLVNIKTSISEQTRKIVVAR